MNIDYIEQLSQLSFDGSDSKLSAKIPPITPEVEADGAQLNDILNSGNDFTVFAPVKSSEIQSVAWPAEPTNTLSNTLLQKADDLGASFRSKLEHVTELVKAGPDSFNLQSVMQIQIEMHSVTLEMDLISNGVHKSTQYVDQLSKIS